VRVAKRHYCAAGTDELHRHELQIIDMIYSHRLSSSELKTMQRLD